MENNSADSDSPSVVPPERAAAQGVSAQGAVAEGVEAHGVEAPGVEAPGEAVRAQRRLLKITSLVLGGLVSLAIAAGFLVQVGYVAFVPGSARETESLVSIAGVEQYPSEGELFFTTVRLRSGLSFWSYLWHQLDDDNEVLREEQVFGTRTVDENRAINLQAMSNSKDLAVAVALERLGYSVITSDGVFVAGIEDGTAAEVAGFEVGEVIVQLNGVPITTSRELIDAISSRDPGTEVTITVETLAGNTKDVDAVLGSRPDDETAAFLGVSTQDRIEFLTDELGIDVSIDSSDVGGPSAGLAFTLAILDQMTEGELTGGQKVAVTGTIELDGDVGAVGGVPQKTAAVRDLGLTTFIVPSALGEDEIALLRERAGSELEIVPVDNLQQALDVLAELGGEVTAVDEFAATNVLVGS